MDSDQTELLLGVDDAQEGSNSCAPWIPASLRSRPTLEGLTKVMDAFLLSLLFVSIGASAYLLVAKEPNSMCKNMALPDLVEVMTLLFPIGMFYLVLLLSCLVRERAVEWSTLLAVELWFAAALLAWMATCICGVPSELVATAFGTLLVVHVGVCIFNRSKGFIQARFSPQPEDNGV